MKWVIAILPLLALPSAAVLLTPEVWPRWAFMWLFAWTIYAGCKWLTWWVASAHDANWRRHLAYLVLWPGLDADAFLRKSNSCRPHLFAWLFAFAKLTVGIALLWSAAALLARNQDLLRGWVGMVGIVFVLHFGLFDVLGLAWQTAGIAATPVMNWPILATSVTDFWGRRWNTAFRDLTHRFLFRPLTIHCGAKVALLVGFAFSGLVHDLVISLPAGAGWGGPTVFFFVQGGAIFLERSSLGRRIGLGIGVIGWAFTMLVLLGPLWLLFHSPFVRGVIVPFVDFLGGIS
ncbi:MAG: hypothetical protein FJ303_21895 [Planctomycetes bacterium]|nr:hypothetical protein [Planctomycetota bacterium]